MFSVKQALDEAGDKLYESEKNSCRQECDSVLRWLESNTLAEKEQIDEKMQYLQRVCSPIMGNMHGAHADKTAHSGAGCSPGATVEEVD